MTVAPGHSLAFEAGLADAFRDLESPIAGMRLAVLAMEAVADGTIEVRSGEMEMHVKEKLPGLASFRVLVMTEDESDALIYVMHHVGDLARALYRAYHAGFDKAREEASRSPPGPFTRR